MDNNKVIEVPLSMLRVNPWQPRNVETHIVPESIVESIRKHGLLQIPVGRMVKNGAGDLVQIGDGWQRWQAFVKLAGQDPETYGRLPVMVRELSDQEMADLAVESNEKRQALNPIELATFFRRYMAEFKVTQEELGAKFSMSQPAIANALRLLGLDEGVQNLIISQEITPTHGRALLKVEDPKQQRNLAIWAAGQKPTVEQLEREVFRVLKDNMRGLGKNAWPRPEFDTKKCEGCEKIELFKEQEYIAGRYQPVDVPYCKDKSCWDRKQQSVTDKRRNAEKAKEEKAIAASPDCVPLDKLGPDAFTRFNDKPFPECKACEHLKKGKWSYSERAEQVCTNPKCYRGKKSRATMLENRFAAQQWEHRLARVMAEADVSSISAPVCHILLDHLIEWRNIKLAGAQLGMSGSQGSDFEGKVKAAAGEQDLATQQKLVLRLLLEQYHDRDSYSQRGDSARKAMVMLLGEQKANEIDSTFAPDLKKPAKKAAAA
jgi:ParB/RepB/Spo0J family partition protein